MVFRELCIDVEMGGLHAQVLCLRRVIHFNLGSARMQLAAALDWRCSKPHATRERAANTQRLHLPGAGLKRVHKSRTYKAQIGQRAPGNQVIGDYAEVFKLFEPRPPFPSRLLRTEHRAVIEISPVDMLWRGVEHAVGRLSGRLNQCLHTQPF